MNQFIYVFTEGDRDKLLAMKFDLLHVDERSNTYIFKNVLQGDNLKFALADMQYVTSNTLSF